MRFVSEAATLRVAYAAETPELSLNDFIALAVVITAAVLIVLWCIRRFQHQAKALVQGNEWRKLSENALLESESRYRLLVDSSPYAIILHQNYTIIFANPAAAKLLGAKASEALLGKSIQSFIRPENWGLVEARAQRVLNGEEGIYPVRDEYVRLDGSFVPVEITIEPLQFNDQWTIQVIAFDITKYVENEKSLVSQSNYLELLNEITAIAAGTSDFEDMLQALADRMGELFVADGCYITLWDDETQTTIPAAAYQDMDKSYPRTQVVNHQQTMTASVLREERPLIAEDVHNSPYIDPAIAAQFPEHSLLGLPLIAGEQKLGAALIAFNQSRIFTDEDITRGKQVAAQIALSIAKAKSYSNAKMNAQTLVQRNRELSILYQASQAIGSTLTLSEVIHDVVSVITDAIAPSGCAISLWHQQEESLETLIDFKCENPDDVEESGKIYHLSEYPATRQVLENGVHFLAKISDANLDRAERAYMEKGNINVLLMLPLISGQRVLGLVELYEATSEREYTADEIQLAQSLCTHAAAAIEIAYLLQEYRSLTNDLEQRVAQRTTELELRVQEVEQLNSAMSNLLEDVQTSKNILEVASRQLEEANQEMEAFSYSVSHDLRAPLRHINAFTQLLLDRDFEHFDPTSRRFLDNIAASSERMSQLIEDLLKFSRTSRTEMELQNVGFNRMLEKLITDAQIIDENREIEWKIHTMPIVQADPALMNIVWTNLISNAIKYTAFQEKAFIEIDSSLEDGGQFIQFSIRDNGVGFDPQYAANLFGVFQRLHQRDEFEGTGIGLATVRRVIHRHGGRVWADSKLNQGATFYFTLPYET